MKKITILLLLLSLILFADFFKSAEKEALKHKQEREHFCKVFTQKAINYQKNMRDDELALLTLESYKKRANIFCSKEKPKQIQKVEKELEKQSKYIKKISHEDERLCKIFIKQLDNYKKNMRDDELAQTTLESYEKRTKIFCSKETLEKKEKGVLNEDTKLCKVFEQGPILCKKFDQNFTLVPNDDLAKETLQSFEKRAKVFCSSKPLNKKDLEVYREQNRLCKIFSDKIITYQKDMRDDELAHKTLESYKKRAKYFCATKKP